MPTVAILEQKCCVIGLGKLGAPLAALLAAKGFAVVGADRSSAFVDAINSRQAPVQEPGLQDLLDRGGNRLRATLDSSEAVAASDVTFIVVPTPTDANGVFSNRFVLGAIDEIGRALKGRASYHLVVVVSTVMPGTMDAEIRPALEAASGRLVGPGLGLCYHPEFIALGSVVNDMLRPDVVLIGESDAAAGQRLADISDQLCENEPAVCRMSMVNAEVTKLAINTFVTTKISYANMLGEICERLPGADASVVTAAIGRDSRIGAKYLKPSAGYGGPCFPRDNVAFIALAKRLAARPDLSAATHALNQYQVERLLNRLATIVAPPATVGVLGMSYKPNTPVVEESFGVAVAAQCRARGYQVAIADPLACDAAMRVLGDGVTACQSAEDCASRADVIVIATAWPEFSDLDPSRLRTQGGRVTIIDCWRVLDPAKFSAVADVVHIGRG